MGSKEAAMSSATTSYDFQDAIADIADAVLDARNVITAELRHLVPGVDVGDIDRYQPLTAEAGTDLADLASLVRALRDTTGTTVPSSVIDERTTLEDLAYALATQQVLRHWRVELTFTDDRPVRTTAGARLTAGLDHLDAVGESRKNPADAYDPGIGREVAAARALTALVQQLLDLANARIRQSEPDAPPVAG
jgi:hypothetical protein